MAWYPVASVPVALGDGAKFFTEAAAERQRQSQATVTMRVTEEFFGEAPNLAVLDGEILDGDSHFPARGRLRTRNRDLHAATNPVGICLAQFVSAHPYRAGRQWSEGFRPDRGCRQCAGLHDRGYAWWPR